MTRLTADFWVHAYLTRLRLADIPAFVTAKGDATAGAVLVKLNTLDGQARCFQRSFDLSIVSVNRLSHDRILSLNPFTMLNSKSAVTFALFYAKVSRDRLSVLAQRSPKVENVEVISLQCEI